MKLFFLSAFGMMMAMSAAAPKLSADSLEAQVQKLQELLEQRSDLVNGLVQEWGSDGDAVPAAPCMKAAPARSALKLGSLRSSSLQPSTGVQSGARGLTSEDDWRRIFPHKPGYSR
jgi:hypothetical protein